MKTKLLTLFLALTSAFMAKANVLPLDWDIIDPSYVYSCSRPINTEYKALKYMKAACDARYLYIRAGFDTQYLDTNEDFGDDGFGGHPSVPFHVFLNNDRTNNGFIGMWNTPNFTLTEGFLFESGRPASAYSPSTYYTHNLYINDVEVKDIVIPNSVTTIGDYAFYECSSLTSVTIPNSVTTIGYEAFDNCSGLTSVTIGNSVKTIGEYAFFGCSGLTSVTAPAIFFDVPEYECPYYSKQLTSVIVNSGELTANALLYLNRSYKTLKTLDVSAVTNTEFADEAFKGCYNLESLTLPQTLERISYMMVAGCVNLKSIDIPASVEEIDQRAFEDCRSIQSVTFTGTTLTSIKDWAFYNCHALQHLEIPEGVTEIGDGAFYGCTYLEDLVLPASVAAIGDNGFALCSKLNKMTVKSQTPPTVYSKTFYDVSRQMPVYVPMEVVAAYKSDPVWGQMNIVGVEMLTDLVQTQATKHQTLKYLRNGQLIIDRNGKHYSAMGERIR